MKRFYILILLGALFYLPLAFAKAARQPLTLRDSIQLALRENPNVIVSQMTLELQELARDVEVWRFQPHVAVGASAHHGQDHQTSFRAAPEIGLLGHQGTVFTLSPEFHHHPNEGYSHNLSFRMRQPLMRGFGSAIVESALMNANDSVIIAKLKKTQTIQTTITQVINAYLDFMMAQKNVAIDEAALKRAEESIKQTELFIESGRKAKHEIITVRANRASARASLANNRYQELQARFNLLKAIGINPHEPIEFSKLEMASLIKKYPAQNEADVKRLAIASDIAYQVDSLTFNGSLQRSLYNAKDNIRPKLDLEFHQGKYAEASLNWHYDFDDKPSQQALVGAKMAIKQARLLLQQTRWNLEINASSNYQAVKSNGRSMEFAEDAKNLQAKTYDLAYQKYLHGLIDSLELQTAQFQLIQAEHALLNAQVAYVKSLVALDELTGHTISTWEIGLK